MGLNRSCSWEPLESSCSLLCAMFEVSVRVEGIEGIKLRTCIDLRATLDDDGGRDSARRKTRP